MLRYLEPDAVMAFWRELPLQMGGRCYAEGELFRYLWEEGAQVPMVYDYCVGDFLEPYLLGLGIDTRDFLDGIFVHNNRSTYVSGKTILGNLEPIVFKIFSYEDLREGLLDLAHVHTENFLPGHRHRIAKVEERPGGLKRIHMAYLTDAAFANPIPYDNEFLTGIALGNLPKMMKLEPFGKDAIRNVLDSRPIEYVLWEPKSLRWKSGRLDLDGEPLAARVPLSQFCARRGLDLSAFAAPDCVVMEILRDYVCPYRKRVVLGKGCAFSAPLYLQVIEYRFERHETNRHLETVVRDITESPDPEVVRMHETLVNRTLPSAFAYHAKAQRLDLNRSVLVKGIAADILAEIVTLYAASGGKRNVFEFAYFKKQKGFRVGFEVHLGRIRKTLEAKGLSMRLTPMAKGTFRFESDVPVSLEYVE
jgi:hypothetical protein